MSSLLNLKQSVLILAFWASPGCALISAYVSRSKATGKMSQIRPGSTQCRVYHPCCPLDSKRPQQIQKWDWKIGVAEDFNSDRFFVSLLYCSSAYDLTDWSWTDYCRDEEGTSEEAKQAISAVHSIDKKFFSNGGTPNHPL